MQPNIVLHMFILIYISKNLIAYNCPFVYSTLLYELAWFALLANANVECKDVKIINYFVKNL